MISKRPSHGRSSLHFLGNVDFWENVVLTFAVVLVVFLALVAGE